MARKKRKVSPKVQERVSDRLDQLQTLYSQKELASKLGVSERSIRNYQNGTSSPDKKTRDKLNQIFRSKKNQITEEKVQKRKQKKENKRTAKKKVDEKKKREPHLVNSFKWIHSQFKEEFIVQSLLAEATEFVAITDGEKGQFVSMSDIATNRIGKPKGTRYVQIMALYITQFYSNGEWVNMEHVDDEKVVGKSDFQVNEFPILLDREMGLQEVIDYIDRKFYAMMDEPEGKRRMAPVDWLAYRLI